MTKFKVGDRVRCLSHGGSGFRVGDVYVVSAVTDGYDGGRIRVEIDSLGSRGNGWAARHFELANPSPVRTVTRREIVPGMYGDVEIGSCEVSYDSYFDAASLRDAARIFNEIADVLDSSLRQQRMRRDGCANR